MTRPDPTTIDPAPSARALGLDPASGREVDGIWEQIGPLAGRNRVAAAFYDGPSWAAFRKWERLFLAFQGGARRARRQILRHLDGLPSQAQVLEVGIGDGENLRFTPPTWTTYGVDLVRGPLLGGIRRFPAMAGRLAWAEAEALPFADATFDACYSVGGFTYFGDHARALAEMARVTRPGGVLVVADELPHIYRYGVGRVIGRPRFVEFWFRAFRVDPDFARMVLDYADNPEVAVRHAWPGATRHSIWSGLGYCYAATCAVDPALTRETFGGSNDVGPVLDPRP